MWWFLVTVIVLALWARVIEPLLLATTFFSPSFSLGKKFRIVQLSDLHVYSGSRGQFLKRIEKKVASLQPDLIVITGDLLCWGKSEQVEPLRRFLKELKAPFGVFAVAGNHDYAPSLTINRRGEYDVEMEESTRFPFLKILRRLFSNTIPLGASTSLAQKAALSSGLLRLLQDANVCLLDNETVQIGTLFNLTGVGEHMGGHADLKRAFKNYDPSLQGILLAHNPDLFSYLHEEPCALVLSGHTHGGQINLPWLWRKFTCMEFPKYKRGVFEKEGRLLYVSRGLGSAVPFRFNAIPEIVCIEWEA